MEKEILEKEERDNFINTTRPVEVFDGTNIKKTSIPSSKESAKSFEVDEITVVKKDINGKSEDAHDHIHEDEDESARIGRAGDPFKRKKI